MAAAPKAVVHNVNVGVLGHVDSGKTSLGDNFILHIYILAILAFLCIPIPLYSHHTFSTLRLD